MADDEPAGPVLRRNLIIEAAMQLAAEGGYDAVQMREVSQRSDVALATIYRYFGSKDVILIYGMAAWMELMRDRVLASAVEGTTVADRVSAVLQQCAQAVDGQPVLVGALMTALSTSEGDDLEARTAIYTAVADLVGAAIGDDDPGIEPEELIRFINHVWFSATLHATILGFGPGYVGRELEDLVRHLL